jgi:hypothetical protein
MEGFNRQASWQSSFKEEAVAAVNRKAAEMAARF